MIPFPKKKYKTIVIDPPWKIQPISPSISKKFHSPLAKGLPYETMTDKELLEFPIDKFTDDTAGLFLWTTHSKIEFAFELLKKWGFHFHCLLTWNKLEGINCWGFTRNSEFVLYGYKKKNIVRLDSKKNMPTSFTERRTTHSTKPQTFYNLLLRSTPEPRIDIFARRTRVGFDVWGNDPKLENQPLEMF